MPTSNLNSKKWDTDTEVHLTAAFIIFLGQQIC